MPYPQEQIDIAQKLWDAYRAKLVTSPVSGVHLPTFEDLKPEQRDAWCEVAGEAFRIADEVFNPHPTTGLTPEPQGMVPDPPEPEVLVGEITNLELPPGLKESDPSEVVESLNTIDRLLEEE